MHCFVFSAAGVPLAASIVSTALVCTLYTTLVSALVLLKISHFFIFVNFSRVKDIKNSLCGNTIGHFRVALSLYFKARSGATPLV